MKGHNRIQRKAYKRNRRFTPHIQWYQVDLICNDNQVSGYIDGTIMPPAFCAVLDRKYRRNVAVMQPFTLRYHVRARRSNMRKPTFWRKIVQISPVWKDAPSNAEYVRPAE